MLYMELTPCSFTHRSYHCYLLSLFLWTEMLYMELFIDLLIAVTIAIGLAYSCGLRCSIWSCSLIYLSQLPLLLVWLILVD